MSQKRTRRRRKPLRRIHAYMSRKLAVLFLCVLLALVGLLLRIIQINTASGDSYRMQVLSQAQQQYESKIMPAKRGNIYDRNGTLLATSNKVYKVILDCKVVNEGEGFIDPTVEALVKCFELDEDDIRKRLTSERTRLSQYQVLTTDATMDQKKTFDEYSNVYEEGISEEKAEYRRKIQGIWFEEDYKRSYPYESLACDVVGFTYTRNSASVGLEGYYNSILSGSDGRRYGFFSSSSDVEQTIIDATDGNNIVSTIDIGVQRIVEKWVNAFKESMGAKNVAVVVEDPSNGEILAMDGGDRYDLNDPYDLSLTYTEKEIEAMETDEDTANALSAMWSNFCVSEAYEPGSVVKPIVMSAAMEKGAIRPSDHFECDGGQLFGANGDTYIKCAVWPESHGSETLADVIANSCNDGMMQIAAKMGTEQFIKTQSLFNFGTRTGIDLPNESAGAIHTTSTMGETELATSAFGQGFTINMIQEINAMCSVINGGYYYQPHVVKQIQSAGGNTVKNIQETVLKQTISSTISSNIREYMEASVLYGTSATSKVYGYSSGGKTGTAEKLPRGNGKYLVSFITFAPVDNPRVVLYVVVDEPNAEEQASSTYAQYIGQAILSELLPFLDVQPDEYPYEEGTPTTELWEGFTGHVSSNGDIQINENGDLVDGQGNLVDLDGNRVDEEGYLLDHEGYRIYDDEGEYVKSTSLINSGTLDGVSNTSAPAPLEADSSYTEEDNNYESEGITNEDAGLD